MPENASQRLGPRSALPAASTGYEVAQVVKASPTDPYSPTAAGTSSAGDLMQALGVASDKVAPVVLKAGEVWAEGAKKKGVEARFVGDAMDPNQSNAFIDGYERMDGQYRGIQFGNAAKEYAATNSHLAPDEFQAGLDSLQKEYVGKLVHQGQLDSFLPAALKGGEHATSIYQEAKNAAILGERNQKVQDIQTGQMKLILDQTAFDVAGIPLSSGFASTATDPVMRQKLMDNLDAFRAAVAPQLRKLHDDGRAAYKEIGLTPAQIATKLVGTVGRLAGDTGVVAITDYMYQKDAAGQSPESANPELVNKLADTARAMDTQINTAQRTNQERIDKKAADQRQSGWMLKLADPATTSAEARGIFLALQSDPHIDPDLAWKMGTHAVDIMNGEGFALKDKQSVARSLEDYIMSTPNLNAPASYKAIMEQSHSLSQATYQHLMEKVKSITDKKGDAAKDRSWSMFQSESGMYRSSLVKTLGVTDDTGKVMLGLDYSAQVKLAGITADGVDAWYRGIERLAKAHGGLEDNIPGADLKTLHDRIIDLHRPAVDAIVRAADQANGYGGELPGPGPQKKPGLIDRVKKALAPAEAPASGASKTPPGIPEDYHPTGKKVGGKPAWASPDGSMIEVEK